MLGLTNLPLVLQLAVALLILDLALYWQHRLFHELPKLWATHKVHHAVRSYGPTRAARHHPLSPMVTTAIWTGFALLGAPVVVFAMAQAFAATNGALQHCGAHLRIGRLDRVFAGPAVHRWHHALDLHDRNFGPNLTVWDQVPWHRLPLLRHMLRIRHTTFSGEPSPDPHTSARRDPAGIGLAAAGMGHPGGAAASAVGGRHPAVGELPADGHPGWNGRLLRHREYRCPHRAPGTGRCALVNWSGAGHPFRADWATDRSETQTDLVHLACRASART